jgi:hypothetical protein
LQVHNSKVYENNCVENARVCIDRYLAFIIYKSSTFREECRGFACIESKVYVCTILIKKIFTQTNNNCKETYSK